MNIFGVGMFGFDVLTWHKDTEDNTKRHLFSSDLLPSRIAPLRTVVFCCGRERCSPAASCFRSMFLCLDAFVTIRSTPDDVPSSPRCRYPNLLFREEERLRLGSVFRLVTKDADREDEGLFPVSALTPPPPRGGSRLPPTWASSLPELRVRTAEEAVPELVRSGALSARQGAAAIEMIRAEDAVVFAACRVAGAGAGAAVASGGGGGGGGGPRGREWSGEAKSNFASILKVVLRERERGGAGVETRRGREGLDLRPVTGGGGSGEKGVWETAGRSCCGDGLDGKGEGEEKRRDSPEVPESFQSDAIALADVALVTGKVSQCLLV